MFRFLVPKIYILEVHNSRVIEQSKYTGDFIPTYYIFAETDINILHVIPFSLHEDKQEFFSPPSFIEERGEHSYFTTNFTKIELELDDSIIMVYGINRNDLTENIQVYSYNKDEDYYEQTSNLEVDYLPFFKTELNKEIFSLVHDIQ